MNEKERSARHGMASKSKIRAHWVESLYISKGYDSQKEFLEADACFACGFDGPGTLERCHITALQDGGGNGAENLHLLCPCCHKDSEMLSGDAYWQWFNQRTFVDRLLSEAVKRGFNAFSAMTAARQFNWRNDARDQ